MKGEQDGTLHIEVKNLKTWDTMDGGEEQELFAEFEKRAGKVMAERDEYYKECRQKGICNPSPPNLPTNPGGQSWQD